MTVVDTTVWIDFFRDTDIWQVAYLRELIERDDEVALTDVVLTEILQGLRDDRAAARVQRRLAPFEILRLEHLDDFTRAASLYRQARAKGVTVRRTLDCLIASVCIRESVELLHNDSDFDHLARTTALRVVLPPST